jgi:hypothetical protein
LKIWIRLLEKCNKSGIALLEVPADGNCLAWSLYALHGGIKAEDFETQKAKKKVHIVRSMVGSAWEIRKHEPLWQMLFQTFCADLVRQHNEEDVPETPKKKGNNKDLDKGMPSSVLDEKLSPPRPANPSKKRVERAAGAKPVPLTARAVPLNSELEQPGTKRMRLQEPEAPDLEEAFHQVMSAEQKDLSTSNIEDVDGEMLDQDPGRRLKAAYQRLSKKPKTAEEVQWKQVETALASLGLTFRKFLTCHREAVYVKKAVSCTGGWWKTFKLNLSKGTLPSNCSICMNMLEKNGITLEKVMLACEAANSTTPTVTSLPALTDKNDDHDKGKDHGDGESDQLKMVEECFGGIS